MKWRPLAVHFAAAGVTHGILSFLRVLAGALEEDTAGRVGYLK